MNARKKFKIPDEIDKSIYLVRSFKFVYLLVVVPLIGLGWLIYEVFPDVDDAIYQQIRLILALLPLTLGVAMIVMRPIRERRNINLLQFLIWIVRFRQRQKKFYFKQKRMGG
ncbi:hypothetical protein J2Z48_002961 [Croceifilum oryzae]|uniref:Uncharacterized protein n=1 Tax=Croceifilum oryzae TaxID=1553429 RepID=A0AAJ1TLK3_9BACL|nr:hypothetical protein [Croceifilum oryzae]MDQ0418757.1 hypothetical protein [Croceifilum oryzae]